MRDAAQGRAGSWPRLLEAEQVRLLPGPCGPSLDTQPEIAAESGAAQLLLQLSPTHNPLLSHRAVLRRVEDQK